MPGTVLGTENTAVMKAKKIFMGLNIPALLHDTDIWPLVPSTFCCHQLCICLISPTESKFLEGEGDASSILQYSTVSSAQSQILLSEIPLELCCLLYL